MTTEKGDRVVAYLNLDDREEYGDHYEDGTPIGWTREVWRGVSIGPEPYPPNLLSWSVPITEKEARELLDDGNLEDTLYRKLGITSRHAYAGLPKGPYYYPVNLDDIRARLREALSTHK